MAYADKLTTMRRMAIIYEKHNIVWEGVNIEGTCLLMRVNDGKVMRMAEDELEDWVYDGNQGLDDLQAPFVIKYQDPDTDKDWEPRKS